MSVIIDFIERINYQRYYFRKKYQRYPDFIVLNENDFKRLSAEHYLVTNLPTAIEFFGMKIYTTKDIEENQFRLGFNEF